MILRLEPIIKSYPWGGDRLREKWNIETQLVPIAEVWAFSCRIDGVNRIADGGDIMSLMLGRNKPKFFGSKFGGYAEFPFMVKITDSRKKSPVEVCPDDKYAYEHENRQGRAEIWYILDCDEDSEIICGFKENITVQQFKDSIVDNTVIDLCKKVNVRKGDTFFIPPGTVHGIGKNVVIVRVSQNSDTHYKIFDYNRLTTLGIEKDLDISKALDVMTLDRTEEYLPSAPVGGLSTLGVFPRFTAKLLTIDGKETAKSTTALNGETFHNCVILEGNGSISSNGVTLDYKAGDSLFIPASNNDYTIDGNAIILITHIT